MVRSEEIVHYIHFSTKTLQSSVKFACFEVKQMLMKAICERERLDWMQSESVVNFFAVQGMIKAYILVFVIVIEDILSFKII